MRLAGHSRGHENDEAALAAPENEAISAGLDLSSTDAMTVGKTEWDMTEQSELGNAKSSRTNVCPNLVDHPRRAT